VITLVRDVVRALLLFGVFSMLASIAPVGTRAAGGPLITRFLEAASADDRTARAALAELAAAWKDAYAAMIIDMARQMRSPRRAIGESPEATLVLDDEGGATSLGRRSIDVPEQRDAGSPTRRRLIAFLERQTKQGFGDDLNRWREWMWKLPYDPHPDYAVFKGLVYAQIDPRMRAFFPAGVRSSIRLDEIDWGGVIVNGIPPLRYPHVLPADSVEYLKDSNVVFGVDVNGEARAYPKRILAWHEMAIDRIGGVELTMVYCTLCGTVIPFDSQAGARMFHFGTSGLLYRSNKMMFDEETHSLWSTFEGVPVVGPLVGSGVALRSRPVVTTTWKEWRRAHPDTTVLSIETGYKRDYSEGAAYREYFATDRLMFEVSKRDTRLRNKAEVLVMTLQDRIEPHVRVPVAISVQVLKKHVVYSFAAAHQQFVIVTTPQGANRVYKTDVTFRDQPTSVTIRDGLGRTWRATEAALVLGDDPAVQAPRMSAQRAFWFGWYAQFPETLLIK
jgi:hypothetical protein